MLVLTRRTKDKVSFPQVGITVHFIRVQSGQVKVGVDAPRDIAIVRDEVEDVDTAKFVRRQLAKLPREVRHGIRNELHQISVGLHLYHELIKANLIEEAEDTFESMQEALLKLGNNEVLRRPENESSQKAEDQVIVLIEDDLNQRQLMAEFLKLRGYVVFAFADGEDALEYLSDHEPPGAVLIDMHMPKCDGRTTVQALRESHRFQSTLIFAVSGTSPEDNGLPMGKQGVDRWFPKPVSLETLLSAIEQSLQDIVGLPQANSQVPAQAARQT